MVDSSKEYEETRPREAAGGGGLIKSGFLVCHHFFFLAQLRCTSMVLGGCSPARACRLAEGIQKKKESTAASTRSSRYLPGEPRTESNGNGRVWNGREGRKALFEGRLRERQQRLQEIHRRPADVSRKLATVLRYETLFPRGGRPLRQVAHCPPVLVN